MLGLRKEILKRVQRSKKRQRQSQSVFIANKMDIGRETILNIWKVLRRIKHE